MKASELIADLERKIKEYGDLPVYHVDDMAHGEIAEIYVLDAGQGQGFRDIEDLPKRFSVNLG